MRPTTQHLRTWKKEFARVWAARAVILLQLRQVAVPRFQHLEKDYILVRKQSIPHPSVGGRRRAVLLLQLRQVAVRPCCRLPRLPRLLLSCFRFLCRPRCRLFGTRPPRRQVCHLSLRRRGNATRQGMGQRMWQLQPAPLLERRGSSFSAPAFPAVRSATWACSRCPNAQRYRLNEQLNQTHFQCSTANILAGCTTCLCFQAVNGGIGGVNERPAGQSTPQQRCMPRYLAGIFAPAAAPGRCKFCLNSLKARTCVELSDLHVQVLPQGRPLDGGRSMQLS